MRIFCFFRLKKKWGSIVGGPSDYSDYSGTIVGYPPSTGGGKYVSLNVYIHQVVPAKFHSVKIKSSLLQKGWVPIAEE